MAYVITRDIPSLKMKKGHKLKHEKDKLPIALLFSAEWIEPEVAEKPAAKK